MNNIVHHALTEKIIRCALEVHTILGTGFLEKIYENALLQELHFQGLNAKSQEQIQVIYKGNIVGDYTADLIIEGKVIVEIKAVEKLVDVHELQLSDTAQKLSFLDG